MYANHADPGDRSGSRASDGPLVVPRAHLSIKTMRPGESFADGTEVLHLLGTSPAMIEKVYMVDANGFEDLGAVLAPPRRKIGAVGITTWPPSGRELAGVPLLPADGATITPDVANGGWGWELLLGMRPTQVGYLSRSAIQVDYRVGDDLFTSTFPAEFVVCNDERVLVEGQCPAPAAWRSEGEG